MTFAADIGAVLELMVILPVVLFCVAIGVFYIIVVLLSTKRPPKRPLFTP
jgi:hypothetical protein